MQSLLQQQNGLRAEAARPEYYGKTDDAILATILKQQGIGPSHNNLPIDVSIIFNVRLGLKLVIVCTIYVRFAENSCR